MYGGSQFGRVSTRGTACFPARDTARDVGAVEAGASPGSGAGRGGLETAMVSVAISGVDVDPPEAGDAPLRGIVDGGSISWARALVLSIALFAS